MALVYRAVPTLSGTIKKNRCIDRDLGNIEGDLYDLGYVSFENGYSFFKSTDESPLNEFFDGYHESCKFFFLFPQDAVKCTFSSIEGYCYNRYEWEILEFDILDEILYQYCGYGFYNEIARVEFCIPESIFKDITPTSIDEKILKNKLIASNQTFMEMFDCNSTEFANQFNEALPIAINAERTVYLSDFITNNKIHFRREELLCRDEKGKLDFLSDFNLTELLQKKGIICCDNIVNIYNSLEKNLIMYITTVLMLYMN